MSVAVTEGVLQGCSGRALSCATGALCGCANAITSNLSACRHFTNVRFETRKRSEECPTCVTICTAGHAHEC